VEDTVIDQAGQDALEARDSGLAVWGLIYIAVLFVLAVVAYLLIAWISKGNQDARSALVALAVFAAGVVVPSPRLPARS
jgi:membrane protein YdbS with pleckstrin-like domain